MIHTDETHWLDPVVTLLCADTKNLKDLVEIAGGNPKTFYIGATFAHILGKPGKWGVDLRGQDLRGLNFSAAQIDSTVRISRRTKFDQEFAGLFARATLVTRAKNNVQRDVA